jgi:glutamine synthetase
MKYDETKIKEVLEKIKENNIERISLQFIDVAGVPKQKGIPVQEFKKTIYKGSSFDGSSIEGYARIQESDMLLFPDLNTYAPFPNTKKARIICDVYTHDGKPFEGSPRYVLKKMIAKMKKMLGKNAAFYVAPELEFYLLEKRTDGYHPHDHANYFDVAPKDLAEGFRDECIAYLNKMGIEDEADHHEVGEGQHEIDIVYGDALRLADETITYKMIVQELAMKKGLCATFMPKLFPDKPGSGMHCHINLVTEKMEEGKFVKDRNLFHDESTNDLSDIAKYSIGGLMAHARGSSAIWCPTVNSYKRLGKSEAPKYIVWAHNNRSALIRIPAIRKNEYGALRIELRCPDPSCNPYLAFAVMLADMLDGIQKKINPPKPVEENIYHLPSYEKIEKLPDSLEEALECLEKDEVVKNAIGKHCLREFINLKRKELKEYQSHVCEWDLRYLYL